MDKQAYIDFLALWKQIMIILTVASAVVSLLIFFTYKFKYWSTKDFKTRFDLASKSEVNIYLSTFYAFGIAIFFFINTLKTETVELSIVWLFIRLFIGICGGTLIAYISFLIFKYYYPGPLSKKLERLRYTPRINPQTGNRMKLLSEAEEDAYLDEGQQAEEDVFSVDYDVWIDPKTGYTQVEKYQGHLTAQECDRCGFQTLRLVKEEVLSEATMAWDGEMEQTYKCSYCNRTKRKIVKISKKVRSDMAQGKLIDDPLTYDKRLEVIKIQIYGSKGKTKVYEFQNLEQAQGFLQEFDIEKMSEEFEPEV